MATGTAKTLLLFAVAAILVRLGLRDAAPLVSIDFLNPRQIFDSVTGLVIQLSTVNELALLGAAAVLAGLTLLAGAIWLRNRARPETGASRTWLAIASRELFDRQTVLVLAGAALIAVAAFGYQRWLWSSLQVPEGTMGIAIISNANAEELSRNLYDGLAQFGETGFVLRPLPVRLDDRQAERRQDTAIDLGNRIGARDASASRGHGDSAG